MEAGRAIMLPVGGLRLYAEYGAPEWSMSETVDSERTSAAISASSGHHGPWISMLSSDSCDCKRLTFPW
jgi:hypothetical protein